MPSGRTPGLARHLIFSLKQQLILQRHGRNWQVLTLPNRRPDGEGFSFVRKLATQRSAFDLPSPHLLPRRPI
jgi:uncharacterized protein YifE (UPF0438 family)